MVDPYPLLGLLFLLIANSLVCSNLIYIKPLTFENYDYDLYIFHNNMKDKKLWSYLSYPPSAPFQMIGEGKNLDEYIGKR